MRNYCVSTKKINAEILKHLGLDKYVSKAEMSALGIRNVLSNSERRRIFISKVGKTFLRAG